MTKRGLQGPVAIGGIGGSGTRAFAEILAKFPFYLGNCLNRSSDNLWFTLLFKRPHWFSRNRGKNDEEIHRALQLFEKAMTAGLVRPGENDDVVQVRRAFEEISSYPRDMGVNEAQAETILASVPPENGKFLGWGWKEPNTHVFLEYLAAFFPDFHYIHVLRHGLDMAFSTNHQQLLNWGSLYGVDAESENSITPQNLLRYWIKANRCAIKVGQTLLGERLLVIRLEDLCGYPQQTIKTMANFVGLDPDPQKLLELAEVPLLPGSSGRYKSHDLTIFSTADIEAVRSFGFEI